MAVNCTVLGDILVRVVETPTTGEPYFSCDNQMITWQDLVRLLIELNGDGDYAVRVTSDDSIPVPDPEIPDPDPDPDPDPEIPDPDPDPDPTQLSTPYDLSFDQAHVFGGQLSWEHDGVDVGTSQLGFYLWVDGNPSSVGYTPNKYANPNVLGNLDGQTKTYLISAIVFTDGSPDETTYTESEKSAPITVTFL